MPAAALSSRMGQKIVNETDLMLRQDAVFPRSFDVRFVLMARTL
jgi:hypothetical protein